MSDVKKYPLEEISQNFIPKEYSPKNNDPYFFRNNNKDKKEFRNLHAGEIEILIKNNNFAEDWNQILVVNEFDPNLVKKCEFLGRVTIGKLNPVYLEHHDLRFPVGISNSTIISCEIGDNVVIRDVHYISHYIISDRCILFNIDEMTTTNHAKFGNGILKEGENESIRIWLEVSNENEGRKVLPFESMLPSDAFIWSKFRDDIKLMKKLVELTDAVMDNKRGYYGIIGENTIIKNCRIIKDVKVGKCAYIKGANKLKNLTILSSKEEPAQIGEGIELVNGIVGYGSKIFYGCKAVRFVMGRNTQLKYGARLINSFLGDNSTVSCCELLNNLIFPFHEQHHNNSFLIATTVLGQSNIAAGATIGSNHNSRAPDGEIIAGRGFWPGLCTNFKHNCKFASFVLIAKGSYQNEMNIQYPFSLVSLNNESMIQIMPGYWFKYNMYAVARNTFKFAKRDKRKVKVQNIEIEYLAPDTVSEILFAIKKLKYLIGIKLLKEEGVGSFSEEMVLNKSNEYLSNKNNPDMKLHDPESVKKHGASIIKPIQGITEYKKMCIYFVIKTLFEYFKLSKSSKISDFLMKIKDLYNKSQLHTKWWNLGGQIVADNDLDTLKEDIKTAKLSSWEKVHKRYNALWEKYPAQKARYSLYVLEQIKGNKISSFSQNDWKSILSEAISIAKEIKISAFASRQKDYIDPFRKMMYENDEEMIEVVGGIDSNSFLNSLKKQTKDFTETLQTLIKK